MAETVSAASPTAARPTLEPRYTRIYVWQKPIRIFHWVNALALVVLFTTGLLISAPVLTHNGEPWEVFVMARIRQIHFIAAYVFLVAYLWRCAWFFLGNRYARSGFPYVWRPSWWRDLVHQAVCYLKGNFGEPHAGHNSLGGLAYTIFVIFLGLAQIVTGFALYSESNPGGFWDGLVGWIIPILGGSFRTHMWHHLFAWGFVFFTILHLYIVWLDAHQYRNGLLVSMVTGYKFKRVRDEGEQHEDPCA